MKVGDYMRVEEILKKLVSFNTSNDLENEKIISFIKNYLEEYNFKCQTYGNDKKILIAKIGNHQNLGFVGHTDTVCAQDTFGSNPYELIEKDGNLYGLGACDMKGGIAAILKAVSEIDFTKLNSGIMLIFTYDEEIGFSGIKKFISENIKYPKYLIIGEPTNNIPMNGSKGALEYRFEFFGKKSHSSMPIKSSNVECIKFLNELLKLEKYFQKRSCSEYEFSHSTLNFGIINGGERVNIVPDHTFATCDFRITNDPQEFKYIKKYVDKISKKYDMKYEIGMNFLPFYNNDDIVNFYEKVTGNSRKKFFGLSEASVLSGNKIILGPGPITAHEDGEHISKESLYNTVKIYSDIIEKICKE